MRRLGIFILCFLFVIPSVAQGTKAVPDTPRPVEKIDAAALLKEIVGHMPSAGSQMMGVLKVRTPDKPMRKIPIKWLVRPMPDQWHDVYQTPDKAEIPPETLIVVHREGSTNHYEYIRDGKKVPEAGTNPFVPFATSDFWLADFGLEFLHWPNPKHLDTKRRKGRPCYLIESRPPNPSGEGYARVVSWIDTENGGLIRAEAYDAKGQLWKEFQIEEIEKKNGRWLVKEIGIRNDLTDTSTRLEFNLEVDE